MIPTPSGWDGNFGINRHEECILCKADTTGETAVLAVCFPKDPPDAAGSGRARLELDRAGSCRSFTGTAGKVSIDGRPHSATKVFHNWPSRGR